MSQDLLVRLTLIGIVIATAVIFLSPRRGTPC